MFLNFDLLNYLVIGPLSLHTNFSISASVSSPYMHFYYLTLQATETARPGYKLGAPLHGAAYQQAGFSSLAKCSVDGNGTVQM